MAGVVACAQHPAADAAWYCSACAAAKCGACVKLLADGKSAQCAACGGLAVPVSRVRDTIAPVARPGHVAPVIGSLWERLPGCFRYLGQRSVLLTLLAMAVLDAALRFFGPFAALVAAAIGAGMYFHIVATSADGDDELDTPDFNDPWGLFAPLGRALATLAPLFVALAWGAVDLAEFLTDPAEASPSAGPLLLLVAWLVLWPLMTCIAAIGRSVVAVYDPRIWVATLGRMQGDYVIAVVVFYAVFLAQYLVLGPILDEARDLVPPVIGPIALAFVWYLPTALRARLLGELCRPLM